MTCNVKIYIQLLSLIKKSEPRIKFINNDLQNKLINLGSDLEKIILEEVKKNESIKKI